MDSLVEPMPSSPSLFLPKQRMKRFDYMMRSPSCFGSLKSSELDFFWFTIEIISLADLSIDSELLPRFFLFNSRVFFSSEISRTRSLLLIRMICYSSSFRPWNNFDSTKLLSLCI